MPDLLRLIADPPGSPRAGVRRYSGVVIVQDRWGAELTLDVGPANKFRQSPVINAVINGYGPEEFADEIGAALADLKSPSPELVTKVLDHPTTRAALLASAAVPAAADVAAPCLIAAQAIQWLADKVSASELKKIPAQVMAKAANVELDRQNLGSVRVSPEDMSRASAALRLAGDRSARGAKARTLVKRADFAIGSPEHRDYVALSCAEQLAVGGVVDLHLPDPAERAPERGGSECAADVGCACQMRRL